MNKTKISKIIIFILTFLLIVSLSTSVFADPIDLGNSLGESDDNTTNFDDDFANQNQNQTTDIEQTPTNPDPEADKKPENDIPYAGPVEDALMVTAFIAFAIMGIYTFVKLSDYSNI